VVDEVEEEVDEIGMAEDVGVEVDMTITAEEGEDMVVVEEEGMAEVGMAQEAGDVTTIVEAEEDMAVS